MGRDIALTHITGEYFICGICDKIIKEPVECRICEQLFCNSCLIEYMENSQECVCPHGCNDPVFEKAGHAFEKILGFIYTKCKYLECNHYESILNIDNHEKYCRSKNKIEIDVSDDALIQRDLFWLKVLNKVMTPNSQSSYMQSFTPGYFNPNTPKVQPSFKF